MFSYKWKLSDLETVKSNGKIVFSCFACGGGLSMGYKMSGYKVIGINEIDQRMVNVYRANLDTDHVYNEPIQIFKNRENLPDELYNLDILDGSPPCSTFSGSGNREKDWGKEKKFREGQAKQVLSDLFFDFIDLSKKLKPKVVVAENVKGMLVGHARGYTKEVMKRFKDAGYRMQLFLLNSATMGVPQKRERVFFIGLRNDFDLPKLKLYFDEDPIYFKDIDLGDTVECKYITSQYQRGVFDRSDPLTGRTKSQKSDNTIGHYYRPVPNRILPTIKATQRHFYKSGQTWLHDDEVKLASSFPMDYNNLDEDVNYMCGMSVPPLMIHRISNEIHSQWLRFLK